MLFHPPQANTRWFIWIVIVPMVLATIWVIWLAISTIWGGESLSYEVTPSTVSIMYGPTTVVLEREGIDDITVIERPTRGRRHFGTNIVGLKQGRWSFEETGAITLYATTVYPLTVITFGDQKWGISPQDPEAFVAAVQSGQAGLFEPVPVDRTGGILLVTISAFLVTGITAVVLGVTSRMFRKIGYELTDDHVVIHGWRQIKIPYADVTDVRVEEPKGIPIKISAGSNIPGLYWGLFSWRGVGSRIRMYATVLRPMVLISTSKDLYGITPQDHETFVQRLKEKL